MANASKLDWQQRVGKEHVERGDTAFAGHVVDGQYGGEPVVPADQMAALNSARRDDDAFRVLCDSQECASVHVHGNDGLRYNQFQ